MASLTFNIGDYKYTVIDDTNRKVKVEAIDKTKSNYQSIPMTVVYETINYTVTNMASCFYNCTNLTSLNEFVIPNSVTDMRECFRYCTNLTSLSGFTISNSVTNMSYCFGSCRSLTSLNELTIPNSVTDMTACFDGCTNLTSLSGFTIPNSVTNMAYCFDGCTNLTSLNELTIPNSVTKMNGCFYGCTGLTSLNEFVIPNSVTDMSYCFYYCTHLTSLDEFVIPNSVTNMSYCFYGCRRLADIIKIPYSVTIMNYCFEEISTPLIVIVENNPILYDCLFYGNTSTHVHIGALPKVTVVLVESANESTWNTILSQYTSTNIVKRRLFNNDIDVEIGDYHYSHSNGNFYATDVIDTTKTTYGPLLPITTHMIQTFENCSNLIVSPKIPNSVTNMSSCFYLCSSLVTTPVIPGSVTNMYNTFAYCEALTSAPIIPNSVTNMSGCFKNCTSLKGNIIINNLPTNGSTGIFVDTINDIYIINNFPTSTTEQQHIANQAAAQWRSIAGQYENVHYEADDKNGPNVSVTCTRTNENQQMDTFGTYTNLIINNIPNDTYLPILEELPEGKTFPPSIISKTEFYIDDNEEALITIDNTGLTSINFNYDLSLSLASDDILNQHILNIKVTDSYGKHTIYPATLLRAAAILDFLGYPPKDSLYLDNPGTGMAIGKFATRSGLDIEYPTTVGQGLTPAYHEQYEPVDISTETFDSSGEYYQNNVLDEYELVENPNVTDFNNGEYYHFKGRVIDLYNPQLIVGQYNVMNPEAIFVVGNGTNENYPSNALEVYYNGTSFADASGIMRAMFNLMHPIGSYYETSLPTTSISGHSFDDDNLTDAEIADCGISWFDPRVMWGGTWVLEAAGMVHVSAGTGYSVNHANDNDGVGAQDGGEATHTLTTSEMPAHNHTQTAHTHTPATTTRHFPEITTVSGSSGTYQVASGTGRYTWASTRGYQDVGTSNKTASAQPAIQDTGGGAAHNNMQPYIVVYRWHRYA